jgi:ribonuclease D
LAKIHLHTYDLPDDFKAPASIAIDTEAMGLKYHRDRLCLVQLSAGDGVCHLVHFPTRDFTNSPNLVSLLTNNAIEKIFHYGRFDLGILMHSFSIHISNVFCTKIASKLARTYSNKHGLKDLCKEILQVDISKQEQTSDWGSSTLRDEQKKYAATDVLYLHKLKEHFVSILKREGRMDLAQSCFDYLPWRAKLDIIAGENYDILAYQSE